MCLRPIMVETGVEVSCRSCDACVAARRFDWVSRGMAEKATSAQTLVLCLTYDAETQENRDAAKFFRYADIRRFFARLRRSISYDLGQVGALRFLVAGEQGDQNQRVHWHCVLFSDVDLLALGEWSHNGRPISGPEEIVSDMEIKRVHWTMWPHGFVTVQVPDEGGMHYALSYALKDQFAVDKARNDKRVVKAENFSAGLFRMSKTPPIGGYFVEELIQRLAETYECLPKLNVNVPELSGYWYPRGVMREKLLDGMRWIKDTSKSETGRYPAQWSSLVASCADNESDLERLLDGEAQQEDEIGVEATNERRRGEYFERNQTARIVERCAGAIPCADCLETLDTVGLGRYGLRRKSDGCIVGVGGQPPCFAARRDGINPDCALRGAASRRKVFKRSAKNPSTDDGCASG